MKKLFAIVIAMSLASTVMAQQTILAANFYGQNAACASGTKIAKGTELPHKGVTFTLEMGDNDVLTLWVAFEVTREEGVASVVLVKWIAPNKELTYCKNSSYIANIPEVEPNGETYHSRSCRTLSSKTYTTKLSGDVTYDCKGKWTVQLCDVDGNVLQTMNGNDCEYYVEVR